MRLIFTLTHLAVLASLIGCSSLSMPKLWSSAPKSDPTAEALFEQGNRDFNDKRYVRALDAYLKIRTDHPFTPVMTQVELKIADSYYRNQQYPEAINAFKEFQSMHPTNENMPFVTLRLGQAHFDQFSSVDRDQKNTEIAKGYFETVVSKYPKSSEAAEARGKLAKCLEYLAEHEFAVAQFYFTQEKFPAARDRFEEIVRKYKDTPTAVKSLFFLGESYRREKNSLRAALAYEAVIQHYPNSKFATDARTQLAQVEKEKHDPLALLLMRDRRPAGAAPEVQPDPSLAKLRDLNLVAKTEVVHENPGDEKGFLRRTADKLNPFSSSGSSKKEEPKQESAIDTLAKRTDAQKKEQSGGFFSSLWPFGKKDEKPAASANETSGGGLVGQIDNSLTQKGIDARSRQDALKPPPADLPNTDDLAAKAPPPTDTAALLSAVDGKLKRSGKDGNELPPAPEAAQAFRDIAATQAVIAKQTPQTSSDVQSSGILSGIDQKLKAQGVEPGKFEAPPTAEQVKTAPAPKPQARNAELEPKVAMEKGPLYLSPADVPAEKPQTNDPVRAKPQAENIAEETSRSSRLLVKGPIQNPPPGASAKASSTAKSTPRDDEPKGVLDQIRQDVDGVGKALNPFRW
jgi:outer membrane protein assembly factor BamD